MIQLISRRILRDQDKAPGGMFGLALDHSGVLLDGSSVMLLENFLQKCSMGYTLYSWILLLKPTLMTSYKPQT